MEAARSSSNEPMPICKNDVFIAMILGSAWNRSTGIYSLVEVEVDWTNASLLVR